MRRRDFVALVGVAIAGWSSETLSQSTTTRPLRLGWVSQNPRNAPFNIAFERRLRELGYIEGQNVSFDFIDTRGDVSHIAAAMKEVVERGVDILLAPGPEVTLRSAMAASSTLPIVMVAIDYDPISLGYVKSLASPGDQVTGIYFQQTELVGKRLQILKELMPKLSSATVFWDRFSADQWKATEEIASRANLRLVGIDLGEQPYNYASSLASAPRAYRSASAEADT